ncbi:hypothetical protein K4L44_05645 [Halosquirtibacter laminarini]|uniref:Uncharacterized protein n=1 Tax=Halosquirtibacter laminarini TaxID=3374600 RepID=A0AC61NM18_9BACT|nr:hypothetical protein K4L44_05645 [Prolixibacteraceae bacterium]
MSNWKKKYNKWYFWISGIVTALGTLPSALAPYKGTLATMGLDFGDKINSLPLVGHWGIMVVGIGVMIFRSAKNYELRKNIIWYSLIEKSYLVAGCVWIYMMNPVWGAGYMAAIIADSLQIIGGVFYLLVTRKEN